MSSSKYKQCRHCNETKPLDVFHNNKEMKDGKSSYCKPCASERSAAWKRKNKDRAKNTNLQLKYKISLEEYKAVYSEQKGLCAICGISESIAPRKTLFVDHCHISGRVRGLLCHHCNTGLGYFMDDTQKLKKAQWYLERLILEIETEGNDR